MEQELTCPKCKGNKFSLLTKDTFKCAYCGNVFTLETKNEEEKTSNESNPQVIYIQAPQQEHNSKNEKKVPDDAFWTDPDIPLWVKVVAGIIVAIFGIVFWYVTQ